MKHWFVMTLVAALFAPSSTALADPSEETQLVQTAQEAQATETELEAQVAEIEPEAEAVQTTSEEDGEAQGPNTGNLYWGAGIDYTSHYVFRGILMEGDGVMLQPWFEGGMTLFEGAVGLTSIDLMVGLWNSLHYDSPTGTSGAFTDPRPWFEADLYAVVSLGFLDSIGLDATYYWYTSPNGLFTTAEEINLALSYDDSDLWSNVAFFDGLQPSVQLGVELDGQGDGGQNEGLVLIPAVEPSLSLGDENRFSVNIAVPLQVGISLSDYYEGVEGDETFGFFDAGLVLGIPLFFIPEQFGSWELSGTFHLMVLGSSVKELNGEWDETTGELVEAADTLLMYGGTGLSLSY